MSRLLIAIVFSLISLPLLAAQPAQVMLFGTFHFKDAGLDTVKVKDIDIFTEANQAYLEALTQSLQGFKPTRVLLEYSPENDELVNERYREYLAGNYELGTNEIYQLGFRIAKLAGHERVYGFDYRGVEWEAEAMYEYAEQHDSPGDIGRHGLVVDRLDRDLLGPAVADHRRVPRGEVFVEEILEHLVELIIDVARGYRTRLFE